LCTADAPHYVALLPLLVTLVECKPIGDILDGIAIEIDLNSYMPSGW
jgi:hypothetical protein